MYNVAIVAPDTSPRNPPEAKIPGEDDSWDFGSGAGFYVDATQEPWNKQYKMYSYVTKELPELLATEMPMILTGTWFRPRLVGTKPIGVLGAYAIKPRTFLVAFLWLSCGVSLGVHRMDLVHLQSVYEHVAFNFDNERTSSNSKQHTQNKVCPPAKERG